jgi:hypothetical protein
MTTLTAADGAVKAARTFRLLWRVGEMSAFVSGDTLLIASPDGTFYQQIVGVDLERAFPEPGAPQADLEPVQEPAPRSVTSTSARPSEHTDGHAQVHVTDPQPVLEPVRGMEPVPVAKGDGWTNLADIDGPSWGPF